MSAPHSMGRQFTGGEGIVDHERHAMACAAFANRSMSSTASAGLAIVSPNTKLGVGLEGRLELLVGAVRGNERAAQAHAAHGVGEQVIRAAVNGRARHHVVAHAGDIEDGQEVCRHARACEHGCRATFHFGDFCGNEVACGVLQAAVEIARLF